MLCERCLKHDVMVHVTTRVRGVLSREHLCAECAQHAPIVHEPALEFLQRQRASSEIIQSIVTRDARFAVAAYEFVWEALDYAMDMKAHADDRERASDGISETELLEVIRTLALLRFGKKTKPRLRDWGVRRCEDFGEIAYNLVGHVFGVSAGSKKEDFLGGYDFDEAFPES